MILNRIRSIDYVGEEETYDLQMEGPPNFIANSFVAHNSGDELNAALENFHNIIGVVIVTMPTTEKDMLRCLYLCSRFALPVIGVIENMNGANCECGAVMVCPKCKKKFFPFGESGIKKTCKELGIKHLGSIPVCPKIADNFRNGNPLLPKRYEKPITNALEIIKERLGLGSDAKSS